MQNSLLAAHNSGQLLAPRVTPVV